MKRPREPNPAFLRALEIAGGVKSLAGKIGVSEQFIYQVRSGERQVPPTQCLPIERALDGRVTRYELRPDVFGVPEAVAE